jgi:hypothetical protein
MKSGPKQELSFLEHLSEIMLFEFKEADNHERHAELHFHHNG